MEQWRVNDRGIRPDFNCSLAPMMFTPNCFGSIPFQSCYWHSPRIDAHEH
jgi:hypothetical protein